MAQKNLLVMMKRKDFGEGIQAEVGRHFKGVHVMRFANLVSMSHTIQCRVP